MRKDNLLGSNKKKDYIWYNLDEQSEEEILSDIKNFLIKK